MKKLALSLTALGALAAFVAFSAGAPAMDASTTTDDGIELACKPRGSSCHTAFECCSQKCEPANGKDTCH